MKHILTIVLMASISLAAAQQLPYYEIPDAPTSYTASTVAARLIDGLGLRYYWATEDLRKEDLSYKPSPDARTGLETLTHIHAMSVMILNATAKTPTRVTEQPTLPFEEIRKQTLENFKLASDNLKSAQDAALSNMQLVIKHGDNQSEFPFWNLINGPISDCIWHVGQIVSFRRASGNPLSNQVSVLTGKVRN